MGGYPSKSTKADQRLKRNNPNAGRSGMSKSVANKPMVNMSSKKAKKGGK